jgi:hypothetical protein
MAEQEKDKPLSLVRIVAVGSGPGADHTVEFFLTVDWFLQEEEVSFFGQAEGQISDWVMQMWAKPIQFEPHLFSAEEGTDKGEVSRDASATVADPCQKEQKNRASTPPDDVRRMMSTLQARDISGLNKAGAQEGTGTITGSADVSLFLGDIQGPLPFRAAMAP